MVCCLDAPAKKEGLVAPVVKWVVGRFLSAISSFRITSAGEGAIISLCPEGSHPMTDLRGYIGLASVPTPTKDSTDGPFYLFMGLTKIVSGLHPNPATSSAQS